jgi:hypothetical protein
MEQNIIITPFVEELSECWSNSPMVLLPIIESYIHAVPAFIHSLKGSIKWIKPLDQENFALCVSVDRIPNLIILNAATETISCVPGCHPKDNAIRIGEFILTDDVMVGKGENRYKLNLIKCVRIMDVSPTIPTYFIFREIFIKTLPQQLVALGNQCFYYIDQNRKLILGRITKTGNTTEFGHSPYENVQYIPGSVSPSVFLVYSDNGDYVHSIKVLETGYVALGTLEISGDKKISIVPNTPIYSDRNFLHRYDEYLAHVSETNLSELGIKADSVIQTNAGPVLKSRNGCYLVYDDDMYEVVNDTIDCFRFGKSYVVQTQENLFWLDGDIEDKKDRYIKLLALNKNDILASTSDYIVVSHDDKLSIFNRTSFS